VASSKDIKGEALAWLVSVAKRCAALGSERFNLSEAKPLEVRKLCLRFNCILLMNKDFGGFQRRQQTCRTPRRPSGAHWSLPAKSEFRDRNWLWLGACYFLSCSTNSSKPGRCGVTS